MLLVFVLLFCLPVKENKTSSNYVSCLHFLKNNSLIITKIWIIFFFYSLFSLPTWFLNLFILFIAIGLILSIIFFLCVVRLNVFYLSFVSILNFMFIYIYIYIFYIFCSERVRRTVYLHIFVVIYIFFLFFIFIFCVCFIISYFSFVHILLYILTFNI